MTTVVVFHSPRGHAHILRIFQLEDLKMAQIVKSSNLPVHESRLLQKLWPKIRASDNHVYRHCRNGVCCCGGRGHEVVVHKIDLVKEAAKEILQAVPVAPKFAIGRAEKLVKMAVWLACPPGETPLTVETIGGLKTPAQHI
jgi:hypothetical protein